MITFAQNFQKMAKETNKRVNIWINGKEVENNIKSIRAGIKKLTAELNKMEIGSEEYIETTKKISGLNKIYEEHRKSIKLTGKEYESLQQNVEDVLKDRAVIAGGISSAVTAASNFIGKIVSGTQEYVTAFASVDDALSGVMKTTGMTREEVEALNGELAKIDTRTSRGELLTIAQIGGRMGLAKEQILDFTRAVDLANVALGDSFSGGAEEISAVLGKVALAFKETRDSNIGEALTRIGSAINEVGASANATEPNIAAFVQRVGAMPEAFRPSVQEAIALGAAFEESSIDAEVASRAFGIVMNKAANNVAAFAKVMGQPVEAVQQLINSSPTQFFTQFAASLNGMDATTIAATLKTLGLNADGVVKIVGAMSGSFERFNVILDTSNEAFAENTSLMNEFATVNNNSAAALAKAQNAVENAKAALGESLLPVIVTITQTTAKSIQVAAAVAKWMVQNKGAVIAYTAAMAALWAIKKKELIVSKARAVQLALEKSGLAVATTLTNLYALAKANVTRNTLAAAAAQKALKAAFASTPWGAVITAVAAIGTALYNMAAKSDNAAKRQKEAAAEFSRRYEEESFEVRKLTGIINDENMARSDKLAAIRKLQQIIPGYTAELSKEGAVIRQNTAAIDGYLESLKKKVAYELAEEEYRKALQRRNEAAAAAEAAAEKARRRGADAAAGATFASPENQAPNVGYQLAARGERKAREELAATEKELEKAEKAWMDLAKAVAESGGSIVDTENDAAVSGGNAASAAANASDKLKKFNEELAAFRKKQRDASIGEWAKTKQDILDSYQEMIDKAKAVGKDGIAAELAGERDSALNAAAQKYIDKYSALMVKFAKEAEKMMPGGGEDSELARAIVGTQEEWDEKLDMLAGNAAIVKNIIDDMDDDDETLAAFVDTYNRMLEAYQKGLVQKAQAVSDTIRQYTSSAGTFLAQEQKELAEAAMTEQERQKAAINEKYDLEIRRVNEAIAARAAANADDPEIENLRQLIELLENLRGEKLALADGDSWLDRLMDFDWNSLAGNWKRGLSVMTEALQGFSESVTSIAGSLNEVASKSAERELNEYKKAQESKKAELQQRLDSGIISQAYYNAQIEKMDSEADEKEKEMELESWRREKKLGISQAIINGAMAIMKGFAQAGPVAGAVLAAIQAAVTAAQIAAIASAPEPYAKGGYIRGKQVALMGEQGDEWVASHRLLTDSATAPVISALQQYQQGNRSALALARPELSGMSQTASNVPTTFAAQSARTESGTKDDRLDAMLGELKTMNAYLKDPKNRQATISRKIQLRFERREDELKEMARL